jgi:site-specific recombinase XerD
MTKYNPDNERIKRKYITFLKEAKQHGEPTLDAATKALHRFETYSGFRDFKKFHFEQAIAFKKHLAKQKGEKSGKPLSKSTMHSTLSQLKRFFEWLSQQTGYKSRIQYTDAEYFNLSEKDTRIATARREQKVPTIEQIKHVLDTMPADTEISRRNRALIAFILLTGIRDSAAASIKLKHVDMIQGRVFQDAREVKTKRSKTFYTYFFPVGEEVLEIVAEWVTYLREEKLWGNDDPLFPSTRIAVGSSRQFEAAGLERKHWSTASPVRTIFRAAFTAAGLPYYNPHRGNDRGRLSGTWQHRRVRQRLDLMILPRRLSGNCKRPGWRRKQVITDADYLLFFLSIQCAPVT